MVPDPCVRQITEGFIRTEQPADLKSRMRDGIASLWGNPRDGASL